jgi:hypothetical protein
MNAVTKSTPETSTAAAVDNRNVHQRLLAVMAEVSYIQKDRPIGNYKVVTHDAVTAKVRPVLVKHGVLYYPQNMAYVQNGNRTEMSLDIKFVNAADPSDFVCVPTLGYGIDAQDKGPGKAISYAVKMALLKALGLETGEDADDGSTEEHKPGPVAKPAEKDPVNAKNAPGVSEAKTWVRNHIHDLNGCGSPDELMEHITAAKPRYVKICGVYPNLWTGPDGTGLRGEAQKMATAYECRPAFDKFIKEVEAAAVALQQPQAAE